jgi:hypothetical protein
MTSVSLLWHDGIGLSLYAKLAKGKTDTGRIWVYVRDDKPFGGPK